MRTDSFHVFTRDQQGYYTVPVFDPLAAVFSYLQGQYWDAITSQGPDRSRIYSLRDAMALTNPLYRKGERAWRRFPDGIEK